MANYKLSNLAKQDLVNIARWVDKNYGVARSDAFKEKLKQHLNRIAENPLLYPDVSYIKQDYRRSVFGIYSIYYRVQPTHVEVMTIIKNQDMKTRF